MIEGFKTVFSWSSNKSLVEGGEFKFISIYVASVTIKMISRMPGPTHHKQETEKVFLKSWIHLFSLYWRTLFEARSQRPPLVLIQNPICACFFPQSLGLFHYGSLAFTVIASEGEMMWHWVPAGQGLVVLVAVQLKPAPACFPPVYLHLNLWPLNLICFPDIAPLNRYLWLCDLWVGLLGPLSLKYTSGFQRSPPTLTRSVWLPSITLCRHHQAFWSADLSAHFKAGHKNTVFKGKLVINLSEITVWGLIPFLAVIMLPRM